MKAWIVDNRDGDSSTVVFAETRGKARAAARWTDVCEDMEFIEIRPRRFPEADKMYRGKREMDWDDLNNRRFLCEHGWCCLGFAYEECSECPTADVCEWGKLKAEEEEKCTQ